jgi:hypothetical protein
MSSDQFLPTGRPSRRKAIMSGTASHAHQAREGRPTTARSCGLILAAFLALATASAPLATSFAAAASPATLATSTQDVSRLIEHVPAATSAYGLHDSAGHTMDTVKIVADRSTSGRYLAVYHWLSSGSFRVGVATSTDLRHWTYRRTLDAAGSQPSIAFSPKEEPFVAVEASLKSHLRFRYWGTVDSMLGGSSPTGTFDAVKTLSGCAEGTPEIRSIRYPTSTSTATTGSAITVAHHYFANCKTDRQALGTLTNFDTWLTATQPSVDQRLLAAGAPGKHGDRDAFTFQSHSFTLYEGAVTTASGMGDWRNFIDDGTSAQRLTIRTAGGSITFANPSVTVLADPAGVPSLLVTEFLPGEGAAKGEAGELIYWQPLS